MLEDECARLKPVEETKRCGQWTAEVAKKNTTSVNRPFPNYLWPLFQSESWFSSFHMKIS